MRLKILGAFALFALVTGAVVGCGSSDSGKTEELEHEVMTLKHENNRLMDSVGETEEERKKAVARYEAISPAHRKELRREAKAIISDAKGKAKVAAEGIEDEASEAEERLSRAEESLHGVREEKAKSTIPGNGTFRAEVNYIPGVYESKGGNLCYWATLNSADNFDIVNNENATGPTIAEITTPYFQTKGCAPWHRIE